MMKFKARPKIILLKITRLHSVLPTGPGNTRSETYQAGLGGTVEPRQRQNMMVDRGRRLVHRTLSSEGICIPHLSFASTAVAAIMFPTPCCATRKTLQAEKPGDDRRMWYLPGMMKIMKLYHPTRPHRPNSVFDMHIHNFAPPPDILSLSGVTAAWRDSAA